MKKYCFFLLVAASMHSLVAKAQQTPDLRAQATEDTRKLAQQISLDDSRMFQVKRLTYDRLVQENDLKQMYSIDPALLQSKMAVVTKEYADKLKGVLTDAQYQRYVAVSTPVAAAATVAAVSAPVLPTTAPAPKAVTQPVTKKTLVAPAKKASAGVHASTTVRSRP
ncbi:hypothetical protein [Hymenobacter lucidus]|uniref:DUF4168 domain-containing protein n=1 Tax=Hymenobacter lucidus TaxID=2880930 RepID=A0ABS8ALZ6_9BACT|nr:hypothetical protein [Hymenobacter lucidus]MCB2407230.1 hypothetical protein [Hymenobacter lucidus]